MAFAVADRVKESTTSTGTGTINLGGTSDGFQTFVAGIGGGNTTYYAISHQTAAEWEVGIGTVTDAATDTLSRDTIISSSNSGLAVNFSAGTKDVIATLPSSKSFVIDNASNTTITSNLVVTGGASFTANVSLGDNDYLRLGDSQDLEIYHDGTQSIIADVGTGQLQILAENTWYAGSATGSNVYFKAVKSGAFEAYHSNSKKLETTASGILTTGTVNVNSVYTLPTTDGTSGQVLTTDGLGGVTFQTPTVGDITAVTAGSGLTGGGTSGDVTLNVGAGTGVTVNADDIAIGQDVATTASPTFAGATFTANVSLQDSDHILLGTSDDLQIYHDGTNSFIDDAGTGNLYIRSNALRLQKYTNENYLTADQDGGLGLYYDNLLKLQTTSSGIQTTGTVNVNGAYTLPTSDGSANQVLQTNGGGAVSFATLSLPDGVTWQAVQASNTTVTSGYGYFVNTTSGPLTLTLPTSPTLGDTISFVDYAGTFDTNNLTVARNGHNIQGVAADLTVSTERAGLSLVYVDATQGWLLRDK